MIHVLQTIEEVEQQIAESKALVNGLCRLADIAPRYPEVSRATVVTRPLLAPPPADAELPVPGFRAALDSAVRAAARTEEAERQLRPTEAKKKRATGRSQVMGAYESQAREFIAQQKGEFTIQEIEKAVGCSERSIQYHVPRFVEEKVLHQVTTGRPGHAARYLKGAVAKAGTAASEGKKEKAAGGTPALPGAAPNEGECEGAVRRAIGGFDQEFTLMDVSQALERVHGGKAKGWRESGAIAALITAWRTAGEIELVRRIEPAMTAVYRVTVMFRRASDLKFQ